MNSSPILHAPLAMYLTPSAVIDFHHPHVSELARHLKVQCDEPTAVAHRTFEWVRDEVRHCCDCDTASYSCAASEVLQTRIAYCFGKSHLLAALLRANAIPAGFCYQKFPGTTHDEPGILHGLNAVLLPVHGWYRVDARGNKPGIDAQFRPPVEQLAYPADFSAVTGTHDIWPEPQPGVVSALHAHRLPSIP